MKKTQSLQRLLWFYALSLVIMLALYYLLAYQNLKETQQQHTIAVYQQLLHIANDYEITSPSDVEYLLETHPLYNISYQVMLITPFWSNLC